MGNIDRIKHGFSTGLLVAWALLTGYMLASIPQLRADNQRLNTKLELLEYDVENVAVLLRTRGYIEDRDLENFFITGIVENPHGRDTSGDE